MGTIFAENLYFLTNGFDFGNGYFDNDYGLISLDGILIRGERYFRSGIVSSILALFGILYIGISRQSREILYNIFGLIT